MVTRIVVFLLVVGLGYLNYTVPKIEDHKAFLVAELQQEYPIPEDFVERIWKDVDYSNFFVCSFLKTVEGSTMISAGVMKNVRLIDDEWVDEIKAKLQKMESNY